MRTNHNRSHWAEVVASTALYTTQVYALDIRGCTTRYVVQLYSCTEYTHAYMYAYYTVQLYTHLTYTAALKS